MASILKVDTLQKPDGSTPTAADLGIDVAGSVVQVQQTVLSTIVNMSTSGVWTATGLAVTITPTSADNKILIDFSASFASENNYPQGFHIYRNGVQITPNGATASSGMYSYCAYQQSADTREWAAVATNKFIDSPNTTSPVTYEIYGSKPSVAVSAFNLNTVMGSSTITAMEIAQ